MAFKFITFCALIAVARAGVLPGHASLAYAAPAAHYAAGPVAHYAAGPAAHYAAGPAYVAHAPAVAKFAAPIAYAPAHRDIHHDDYDPNPQYSFAYDIQDGLTGDSKSQHETRNGDVVSGHYSLVDPDGTKRTVEYTADPHNGFNAVVHKEPLGHKVVAAAPAAYAHPIAKVAAPLAYAHAPAHYLH